MAWSQNVNKNDPEVIQETYELDKKWNEANPNATDFERRQAHNNNEKVAIANKGIKLQAEANKKKNEVLKQDRQNNQPQVSDNVKNPKTPEQPNDSPAPKIDGTNPQEVTTNREAQNAAQGVSDNEANAGQKVPQRGEKLGKGEELVPTAADVPTDDEIVAQSPDYTVDKEGNIINAQGNKVGTSNTTTEKWMKSRRKKYLDTHTLKASQDDPANRKYINFKQDYVVLIRKKPFYAATAQQRTQKDDKTGKEEPLKDRNGKTILPEDNYLRVYQVNNFSNMRVSTSVNGKSPGTCSVTIKGAERVICADNDQQGQMGWFSWSDLVGGWLNIDEGGAIGDGTGVDYTTSSINEGTLKSINKDDSRKRNARIDDNRTQEVMWNTGLDETSARKAAQSANGKSWKTAEAHWAGVQDGTFDEGTTFRNLLKTREAKYGWRFAEKCDWEPMDEILVFGKSRSTRVDDSELDDASRDENGILNGYKHNNQKMFKMEPLFFGYIETITKTYNAGKGGCLIQVQAKDHLKLLEISKCCTQLPLYQNLVDGIDINWSTNKFGFFKIGNELFDTKNSNVQKVEDTGYMDAEKMQQPMSMEEKYLNSMPYLLDNILAGLYADEAVQMLCMHAGIPSKFLLKRIEPFHQIPPYFPAQSQKGPVQGKGEMKSRHAMCCDLAARLMVEFFADEAGNIVLKIPNYTLGANLLRANCGGIQYPDDIKTMTLPKFKVVKDKTTGIPIIVPEQGSNDPNQDVGNAAAAGGGGLVGSLSRAINSKLGSILGGKLGDAVTQMAGIYSSGSKGLPLEPVELKESPMKEGKKDNSGKPKPPDKDSGTKAEEELALITEYLAEDILDINNDVIQLDNHRIQVIIDNDLYKSLYDLAKRYFNNPSKWKLIASSNKIEDPTSVLPGDKLIISFDEDISEYIITTFEDTYDEKWLNDKVNAWNEAHSNSSDSAKLAVQNGYATIMNSYKNKEKNKRIEEDKIDLKPFEETIFKGIEQDLTTGEYVESGDYVDEDAMAILKNGHLSDVNKVKWPPLKERGDRDTKGEIAPPKLLDTKSLSQQKSEQLQAAIHANTAILIPVEKVDKDGKKYTEYISQDATTVNNKILPAGTTSKDSKKMVQAQAQAALLANEENAKNTQKNKWLSGKTDIDIIPIKPEYIISFTLLESDREVYNYFHVGCDNNFHELSTASGKDSELFMRAIPWMDNILQFGLRQHPGTIVTPWTMDAAMQECLGVMLTLASQANRYSGSLTCIDDPAIKVGDPVRFHMYDEHPIQNAKYYLSDENEASNTPDGDVFDENIFPEQAVFYVTAIERSIDPSNTSTMTLQLKAGRKMGVASVFDVMSLMYNMYYKDFQTRGFYEANGGNDTAVKTPHLKDENQERQEHEAYRRQRSAPDKNQSKGKESNNNSDGTSPMRGRSEGKKP